MVIKKTMSNLEIYNTAIAFNEAFETANIADLHFPVKVNFYLQKNMNTLMTLAKEIEQSRANIVRKFGVEDEEGMVTVPDDKAEEATKELQDLFSLEQEVSVNALELDWFDGIDMTPKQVASITFMINDEE